jgi:ribosomal protein S14
MLSKLIKDNKIRKLYKNKEINKIGLKFLFVNLINNKNFNLKKLKKIICFLRIKIQKKNFKTKIVRRCILNNRARSSLRQFSISRIILKELLTNGIIPGYSKSMW